MDFHVGVGLQVADGHHGQAEQQEGAAASRHGPAVHHGVAAGGLAGQQGVAVVGHQADVVADQHVQAGRQGVAVASHQAGVAAGQQGGPEGHHAGVAAAQLGGVGAGPSGQAGQQRFAVWAPQAAAGPIQYLVQSSDERRSLTLRENVLSSDLRVLMSMHRNNLKQREALFKQDVTTARILRHHCNVQQLVNMQSTGVYWHGYADRMLEDTIVQLFQELGRVKQLKLERI